MKNAAEEKVSNFYNRTGWKTESGITEDARRFEDLRENAREYVSKCRLRVLRYIPDVGNTILDMASGPIQYKEYLEYSRNFNKRYCVDLSSEALDAAKEKIGNHGVFLCGSWLEITLDENFFDCAISLHTIYHIDKDKQEEAVRKLVNVTKPGKPVIIVYSNPHTLLSILKFPFKLLLRKLHLLRKNSSILYFYAHPIRWWNLFEDIADVKIVPWRSFDSSVQKILIPNNKFGKKIFEILFYLEEVFPNFFVKNFQYPMIILTKRS
jgi:SAM-dependent methyltransferase